MALSYQSQEGLLIIPGAYGSVKVSKNAAGLASNGVILLLGEASQGPDYTQENRSGTGLLNLGENAYGPNQLAAIKAKYGEGPLVAAFAACATPMNDPDIVGAPQRIIVVKTNVSGKASGALTKVGGGTYATLYDRLGGEPGNLINYAVTAGTAEVVPTTSLFTLAVANIATAVGLRVNGGASVSTTIAAADRPPATVTALDALTGVDAAGGTDRLLITVVAGTLAVAIVSGNAITLTISTAWSTTPTVGDTLYISATSAVKGGSNQNAGSYVITAATSTVISATKVLDATGAAGALTPPIAVTATAVASASADAQAYAPVSISVASGNVIDGTGKSLEVTELTSASGRLSYLAYIKGTITPVTWVSKTGSAKLLTSAAEYQPVLSLSRASEGYSDTVQVGGGILLQVGYTGTSASAVIASKTMTMTVVGGSGTSQTIDLSKYATINDLVAFLNTKTGYSAAAGNAPAAGSQSPLTLDPGTFTFATEFGVKTGRIKQDGYTFWARVHQTKVQIASPELTFKLVPPTVLGLAGLPDITASAFLSGGTRGATTDALIATALTAAEKVRCNFVVACFSCDAATDIADGLTDSASTYSIASVIANLRTHVLAMSTKKRGKQRQGFVGFRGSFTDSKATASGTSSARMAVAFEDDLSPDPVTGTIVAQRPHIFAAKVAGGTAAGLYKSTMRKGVNTSGAFSAAGDFDPEDDTQVEDALLAGLLVVRRDESGQWYLASDQTTYGLDANAVLNSVTSMYLGDLVVATARQRANRAIVGQPLSDMTAGIVAQVVESGFSEVGPKGLKLLAPSDGAEAGYKNLTVQLINGNAYLVQGSIFINGAVAFVDFSFTAEQVVSSSG